MDGANNSRLGVRRVDGASKAHLAPECGVATAPPKEHPNPPRRPGGNLKPRILPYKWSTLELLGELLYTAAQLRAHPLSQELAADFEALLAMWERVAATELRFIKEEAQSEARLDRIDEDVDVEVDGVSQTTLVETKQDRSAPLYLNYFGTQRPFEVSKPRLGAELETVRSWLPSLKSSSVAKLREIGARLERAVAEADVAVVTAATLVQQQRDFATIGERKTLVDALNTLRQQTYAKLVLIAETPANELPRSFPDRFFRREHRERKTVAPVSSIESVDAEIAALEEQLAERKALRARLEAERQAADAAKAAEAELALLERRAKELRARLGK